MSANLDKIKSHLNIGNHNARTADQVCAPVNYRLHNIPCGIEHVFIRACWFESDLSYTGNTKLNCLSWMVSFCVNTTWTDKAKFNCVLLNRATCVGRDKTSSPFFTTLVGRLTRVLQLKRVSSPSSKTFKGIRIIHVCVYARARVRACVRACVCVCVCFALHCLHWIVCLREKSVVVVSR